nr:uncharacterized protein LOC113822827 [Penaeus vannamei]
MAQQYYEVTDRPLNAYTYGRTSYLPDNKSTRGLSERQINMKQTFVHRERAAIPYPVAENTGPLHLKGQLQLSLAFKELPRALTPVSHQAGNPGPHKGLKPPGTPAILGGFTPEKLEGRGLIPAPPASLPGRREYKSPALQPRRQSSRSAPITNMTRVLFTVVVLSLVVALAAAGGFGGDTEADLAVDTEADLAVVDSEDLEAMEAEDLEVDMEASEEDSEAVTEDSEAVTEDSEAVTEDSEVDLEDDMESKRFDDLSPPGGMYIEKCIPIFYIKV